MLMTGMQCRRREGWREGKEGGGGGGGGGGGRKGGGEEGVGGGRGGEVGGEGEGGEEGEGGRGLRMEEGFRENKCGCSPGRLLNVSD